MKDRLQCIAMHCTVFAQKHSLQEPATSDLTRAPPQMQQSSPSSGSRQPALSIQEPSRQESEASDDEDHKVQ